MKIALVIERMDAARGGRETSTAQLADALSRAGQEVTILCQSGQSPTGDVQLRVLPARGLTRRARLRCFGDAVAAVAGEFDIVHAMLPLPGANVIQLRSGTVPGQARAARQRRGPLLGPLLDALTPFNRQRRFMGQLELATMANPRVLMLPVSQLVADEIARHYGRRDNVRVIYNAVQPPAISTQQQRELRQQLRRQVNAGDDETVFLTVAKNYALKGVKETIEAFDRWHKQASRQANSQPGRLIVVGRDRVECEGYVRHAAMRGLGQRCLFLPHDPDVARWFAAADVNVLLSWFDPCSRVVLEAACLGLPSITTAMNGASEILTDGAGVIINSPRDITAATAAMHTLSDPATRAAARDKCLALVPKLAMSRHVKELLKAYETVARKRSCNHNENTKTQHDDITTT